MNEIDAAKQYWAAHHNQSTRLTDDQPHRHDLARYILSHRPQTVLEFGCNSGRNLAVLALESPTPLTLAGIDLSETAIDNASRAWPDIDFILGDEHALYALPENHFDVVFTCSVLDHIPHPYWQKVYDAMVRVASKAVVLLEPILYAGGSLYEINFKDTGIQCADYSYAHDYTGYDPSITIIRKLPITPPTPQYGDFFNCYYLMERCLDPSVE